MDSRYRLKAGSRQALMLALTIVLAGDVRAQGDLDLLTASAAPNVMILFDNSGSMEHAMWHDDFNPHVFYDSGIVNGSDPGCRTGSYGIPNVPEIADSENICPGSGGTNDTCPRSESYVRSGTRIRCRAVPGGCSAAPGGWSCRRRSGNLYDFTLRDITAGSGNTRWSRNYLNWLFTQIMNGNTPEIPRVDRLTAAQIAIKSLIDDVNPDTGDGGYREKVRFGIATFDHSNGGFVRVPIGPGNKSSLMNYIDTIEANTWTPLAETLVDVGRYFAGAHGLGTYARYNRNDITGRVPPSPIDSFCRKNFVIVMTDGQPTKDLNDHHGSDFTSTIGNADGDSNEIPDATSGRTSSQFTPPYSSDGTDWLDDVAFYLKNADLDPTLAGTQNIVTYTVGFNIDHPLLQETADNGSGRYFSTSNADVLVARLGQALQEIIERATTFSATTVPTGRTAFGDGFYTAFFKPSITDAFWPGHLQAYRLSADLEILDKNGQPALDPSTHQFKEPRAPFWDAQEELSKPNHPPRNLYTTKDPGPVRVKFDTSLNRNDLDIQDSELTLYPNYPSISFASADALTYWLIRYFEGSDTFDQDGDGDYAELREFVLGDIFHSNPLAIGPPSAFLSREEGFGPAHDPSSFLGRYGRRARRIYAGANDGMLHAFKGGEFQTGDNPETPGTENGYYDLGDGQEAFGFVPGFLLDQIKYIPRNLPRQHYYVDGSPSAADVWLPSDQGDVTKEPMEWATVLVTGMRQGGSGYLALDVTDPDATSGRHGPYPKYLWEFDETDAPLGETWSEPVITRVKLKLGTDDLCGLDDSDDGPCREQWVAIFGGGYRKDGDPNLSSYVSDPSSPAWTNASKGVFMVDIKTGSLIGQVLFDPDPSAVTNNMRFSIPSTPAVLDLDFDGFADVVYIGDLGGQLWRWDISAVGVDASRPRDRIIDNWPVGRLFRSYPAILSRGGLHYHSIFFSPVATYLNGALVLAFASGERSELTYEGELADDDNNRFWVLWDRMPLGIEPTDPDSGWLTLAEGHTRVDGRTRGLNEVTDLETDPEPDDDGYFIKVPDGEKFTTNHVLYAGILLTLSYVPNNVSGDTCGAVGSTNIWAFDLADGGGLLDENAPPGNDQRGLYLGPGAPTDPRITVSKEKVVLIGQTSLGTVFEFDVPAEPPPPVELVFWRQMN